MTHNEVSTLRIRLGAFASSFERAVFGIVSQLIAIKAPYSTSSTLVSDVRVLGEACTISLPANSPLGCLESMSC